MEPVNPLGPVEERWAKELSGYRPEGCLEAEELIELAERGRRAPDYERKMDHVTVCRGCRAALRDFQRVDTTRWALLRQRFFRPLVATRLRQWGLALACVVALAIVIVTTNGYAVELHAFGPLPPAGADAKPMPPPSDDPIITASLTGIGQIKVTQGAVTFSKRGPFRTATVVLDDGTVVEGDRFSIFVRPGAPGVVHALSTNVVLRGPDRTLALHIGQSSDPSLPVRDDYGAVWPGQGLLLPAPGGGLDDRERARPELDRAVARGYAHKLYEYSSKCEQMQVGQSNTVRAEYISVVRECVPRIPSWWAYERTLVIMRAFCSSEQDWRDFHTLLEWLREKYSAVPDAQILCANRMLEFRYRFGPADWVRVADMYRWAKATLGDDAWLRTQPGSVRRNYAVALWQTGVHDEGRLTALASMRDEQDRRELWMVYRDVGQYSKALETLVPSGFREHYPAQYAWERAMLLAKVPERRAEAIAQFNNFLRMDKEIHARWERGQPPQDDHPCAKDRVGLWNRTVQARVVSAEVLAEAGLDAEARSRARAAMAAIGRAEAVGGWFANEGHAPFWKARALWVMGEREQAKAEMKAFLNGWRVMSYRRTASDLLAEWTSQGSRSPTRGN